MYGAVHSISCKGLVSINVWSNLLEVLGVSSENGEATFRIYDFVVSNYVTYLRSSLGETFYCKANSLMDYLAQKVNDVSVNFCVYDAVVMALSSV